MLKIVVQVSSQDETEEIESVTKSFVGGNRTQGLAQRLKTK